VTYSLTNEEEIERMLQILNYLLLLCNSKSNNILRRTISTGLQCIFSARSSTRISSNNTLSRSTSLSSADKKKDELYHSQQKHLIVLLFDLDLKTQLVFLKYMERAFIKLQEEASSSRSVAVPSTALILGTSLLLLQLHDTSDNKRSIAITKKDTFHFVGIILTAFPSLASRFYPIYMHLIQVAITKRNDTLLIIDALNSLCQHICQADLNCAKETLSKFTEWTDPKMPIALRSTILRLFPKLCGSSKRMFGRAAEILGKLFNEPSVEIRVAIAATMADFCLQSSKNSIVVDSLIGPLQGYLQHSQHQETSPLIVALAVNALHHLCCAGSLDYGVTLKVLSKRLGVSIMDTSSIARLDPTIIKALVTLLGDGEIQIDESSTDGEESEDEVVELARPSPPAAIADSIAVLRDLVTHHFFSSSSPDTHSTINTINLTSDIRQGVYSSLSSYSFEALSIDGETIREAISSIKSDTGGDMNTASPYVSLVTTIHELIRKEEAVVYDDDIAGALPADKNSLTLWVKKVMLFEQETLGLSLWKRDSIPSSKADQKSSASKVSLAALPSASILHTYYLDKPSSSSAIAYLSCIGTSPGSSSPGYEGEMLDIIADLACDILPSTSDPVMRCLIISSWMNALRNLWVPMFLTSSAGNADEEKLLVIQKIANFSQLLEDPDNTYIALSISALVISSATENSSSSTRELLVDAIFDIVNGSVLAKTFVDDDDACLCLCFLTASYVRCYQWGKVDGLLHQLTMLQDSSEGGAGFGYLYGMSIVAHALDHGLRSNLEISAQENFVPRIKETVSQIAVQFVDCISTKGNLAVLSLPAMVKGGNPTSDFVHLCSGLDAMLIEDNAKDRLKTCCLALSLALPALCHVSIDLVQGWYHILEKLPSGSGKGFVMPIAMKCCIQAGLLHRQELTVYLESLLIALNVSEVFLEDESFAAVGVSCLVSSPLETDLPKLLQSIVTSDTKSFDATGRAAAILALCATLGTIPTFPVLAIDESSVLDPPQLRPRVQKQSIASSVQLFDKLASDFSVDRSTRESAMIALGILSSMREKRNHVSLAFTGAQSEQKSYVFSPSQGVQLAGIPRAANETLVRRVLDYMTGYITDLPSSSSDFSRRYTLLMLLSSLTEISLPMQYARLIEFLLHESQGEVQVACLSLLSSQIQPGVRAGDDRGDFVGIVLNIGQLPLPSFNALLGSSEARVGYFTCVANSLPKIPSGAVQQFIASLWNICLNNNRGKDFSSATEYLRSIHISLRASNQFNMKSGILVNANTATSLSPTVTRTITTFLFTDVFQKLTEFMKGFIRDEKQNSYKDGMHSIWNEYCRCIANVSLDAIDSERFCTLNNFADQDRMIPELYRSSLVVHLIFEGIFGDTADRKEQELTKVQSWMYRQNLCDLSSGGPWREDTLRTAMRLITFSLAQVSIPVSEKFKKETVARTFEAMMVIDNLESTICLEFLAFQAGAWAKVGMSLDDECTSLISSALVSFEENGMNFDMSKGGLMDDLLELFLIDLPINLAAVCSSLGKGFMERISKQAIRLCTKLSDQQQQQNISDRGKQYANLLRKFSIFCNEDPAVILSSM